MKKLLTLIIIVVLLVVFLAAALPVSAERGNPGEPPGWSIVNPGNGGSTPPGPGPSTAAVGPGE